MVCEMVRYIYGAVESCKKPGTSGGMESSQRTRGTLLKQNASSDGTWIAVRPEITQRKGGHIKIMRINLRERRREPCMA